MTGIMMRDGGREKKSRCNDVHWSYSTVRIVLYCIIGCTDQQGASGSEWRGA